MDMTLYSDEWCQMVMHEYGYDEVFKERMITEFDLFDPDRDDECWTIVHDDNNYISSIIINSTAQILREIVTHDGLSLLLKIIPEGEYNVSDICCELVKMYKNEKNRIDIEPWCSAIKVENDLRKGMKPKN